MTGPGPPSSTDLTGLAAESSKQVTEGTTIARLAVTSAIGMCILTVLAVLVARIAAPADSSLVTTILSVTTPITIGLTAVALQGLNKGMNGRLTQLVDWTTFQDRKRAEGKAETIRRHLWEIQQFPPGTPEHTRIADQIIQEAMVHFEVAERRRPIVPPAASTSTLQTPPPSAPPLPSTS